MAIKYDVSGPTAIDALPNRVQRRTTEGEQWLQYFYNHQTTTLLYQGFCTKELIEEYKPSKINGLGKMTPENKDTTYDITVKKFAHNGTSLGYFLKKIPPTLLVCAKCNDRRILQNCKNCNADQTRLYLDSKIYIEDDKKRLMCNACGIKHQEDTWICSKCTCSNRASSTVFYEVERIEYALSHDGNCFIATAAYSSPYAVEVEKFRDFRDTVLVKSWFGRAFIAFYYKTSPPLADFIAEREYLKAATRKWLLAPLLNFLCKK
jgi:hypothetical protein